MQTDRTFQAGGRTIGYAEAGDPDGYPVLLFHGFGDSRLTRHPDDERTASLGVRLITMDRPGIGLTDPLPVRTRRERARAAEGREASGRGTLVERVADVEALADHLGLDRFPVLGWSGAGPHALACGYRLPDRITTVGVASGFAPLDRPEVRAVLSPQLRQGVNLIGRLPFLAGPLMRQTAKGYRTDPAAAFDKQFGTSLSAADRQVLADPAVRDNMLAGAVEAVRQGPRGLAAELRLLFAGHWGFNPEDVTVPAQLWYGDDDQLVPVAVGRYLASVLPDAALTVYPGEGHLLYHTHWDEILKSLARQ